MNTMVVSDYKIKAPAVVKQQKKLWQTRGSEIKEGEREEGNEEEEEAGAHFNDLYVFY